MNTGMVHSFQSLGTVDGPGIRAVVFMQGCPLRCICCHNPDTWDYNGGNQVTDDYIFKKIMRCKNYFGKDGGVTVSGGEPLMQPDFLYSLFDMLKSENIHTALDTSGCILNEKTKKLLSKTDLVLLDYKYTNDADYYKYTKCEKTKVDNFLNYLQENHIDTWIRHVVINGLNDNESSIKRLAELKTKYSCIKKIELLPFRKLCIEKYRAMNVPFLLENTPETTMECIKRFENML